MIDQELTIEPPPSLEAILSHGERIGRVDFTHRLVAAPPPPVEVEDERGTDESDATEDAVNVADGADGADGPTAEPAHPGPEAHASTGGVPVEEPSAAASPEEGAPTRAVPDEAARVERATPGAHEDAEDFLVSPPLLDSPTARAGDEASAQVAALLSLVPAEDMETVTEDVSEVVEGVLARMREVQSATLAHLEAIEVEAALRCEMLTAQAELDAELIRLHARREAHAIVAAARARSGLPVASADDVRRLDHLAAAASRFGESLEELGQWPGSPDHPSLP